MQGGFSIADLVVYKEMPQVQNNGLSLTNKKIVSLAGIYLLPEQTLSTLKILYLDNNQITAIPDAIGNLTNLQKLSLRDNKITTIPDAIGRLTNLQFLYLDNNQITEIPDAIDSLTELLKLDLSNNQLTQEVKDRIRQLLPNAQIEF
jgi:Leucine-rich repeat (LRR) protein